jgi:hypothetical protein
VLCSVTEKDGSVATLRSERIALVAGDLCSTDSERSSASDQVAMGKLPRLMPVTGTNLSARSTGDV